MRRVVTSESPLWKSGDVRQCDLLAWQEMRNSTSLVADEAFFWLKLDRDANKGWGLAWIARNPGTDYDGWGYAIRNDAKWMPYIFYTRPPSNTEVYKFLQIGYKYFQWPFEPCLDWQLVKFGLNRQAWTRDIGQEPKLKYKKVPIPYFSKGRSIH